jgi:hypothetical protein
VRSRSGRFFGSAAAAGSGEQLLADRPTQVVGEGQVADAVARRLAGLVVPLQQPLGVRERAVLLDVRRRGEEEHLGLAVLGDDLAGLDLGESFQNVADSISTRSRTTSQSSCAIARRCSRPCEEPTAGFCPHRK